MKKYYFIFFKNLNYILLKKSYKVMPYRKVWLKNGFFLCKKLLLFNIRGPPKSYQKFNDRRKYGKKTKKKKK